MAVAAVLKPVGLEMVEMEALVVATVVTPLTVAVPVFQVKGIMVRLTKVMDTLVAEVELQKPVALMEQAKVAMALQITIGQALIYTTVVVAVVPVIIDGTV